MRRPPTLSVMLAAALGLLGVAGAAGTPAGLTITNQATAEALPEGPGSAPLRAVSNTVSTTVQAVCSVSVTPDGSAQQPGQRASARSGEVATFAYRVVNTGNAPFPLGLEALLDPASTAALSAGDLRVYRDTNGGGALDAGEGAVTSLTLNPDEGANTLLVVSVPRTTKGLAYVALGASCAPGEADRNNVAELRIDGVPRVVFEKTFGAATVAPGSDVPVTLRVRNEGNEAAADLTVTDVLSTPELAGLGYVPGSLRAGAGAAQYSADGKGWQGAETSPVNALRWTLPLLPAGAAAELTFALRAGSGAAVGPRTNVATLQGGGGETTQARADVTVGALPRLALGPVNNPEANPGGELSADDVQSRSGAALNQPVCFAQTVRNTGNLDDRVTVRAALDAGQADVALSNLDGTPLTLPLPLAVGASFSFQACLTPRTAADLQVRLTAQSSVGAPENSTLDRLTGIDARPVALVKTVDPQGTVTRGRELTYTLAATNPYTFPLTSLTLRDTLPGALEFVSADAGGTHAGGTVTWKVPTLAPGATLRLTVVARVRADVADGTMVENRFSLTSDQTPGEQTSAPVATPVWTAALVVEKAALGTEVTPGDRLTYRVRLRNTSPAAELRDVTVTDTLPAGLAYLPGSARLDGAALADPAVSGQTLTWTLPAPLPAQQTATLTYDVRVLPGSAADLTNVAHATAQGGSGQVVSAVASNVARAAVRVRPSLFGFETATLIGRVFVDRDRDGVYREGFDTPVERARVILANGRSALTDAQGRYHFAAVTGPAAALRLDPNSVPYPALSVPGDGGRGGSRNVLLTGLTSVDFPLGALMGEAAATRSTTVRGPGFTLGKTVTRAEDGTYTVRLTLTNTAELQGLDLTDPLPQGATLLEGGATLSAALLPAGETVLTYRFRLPRPDGDAVTDPAIRWRSQ